MVFRVPYLGSTFDKHVSTRASGHWNGLFHWHTGCDFVARGTSAPKSLSKNRMPSTKAQRCICKKSFPRFVSNDEVESKHCIRFIAPDRPGPASANFA